MAHISYTLAPHFTGHIGPVRFVNGHGECDDPEVVEFFTKQPELYDVTETDPPRRRRKPTPEPEPTEAPDPEE